MNTKEFIKNATRTESIKSEIKTNEEMILNIAKIFLLSGQMLDQYKKNIFYNRDIKQDVLVDNFRSIADAMTNLSYQFKTNSQMENNDILPVNPRLFHGIVGISTEATELMEQMVSSIEESRLMDSVNVLEETFDVAWYSAIIHDTLQADMEHTFACGIDKLRKRFPEKFSDDNANNRDVDSERAILDNMVK